MMFSAAGKKKNEAPPLLYVRVFVRGHRALCDDVEPLDTGRMNISDGICFPMFFDRCLAEHVSQIKGKPLPDMTGEILLQLKKI